MLDIVGLKDGDLQILDSIVMKAGNVVNVQLGDLEYAPDFGSDLKYFLQSPLQFMNESFKTYLVSQLTYNQVNVTGVIDTIQTLSETYNFAVGDANNKAKGLIK